MLKLAPVMNCDTAKQLSLDSDVSRRIIKQLVENVAPHVFTRGYGFDGRKNLYAPQRLFENGEATVSVVDVY